ncbi:MAG TPA: hypothetical protein VN436_02415, partial [Holophaga sp.]|nr:hypothetical protein [Holophaga sp.]
MMLRLKRAKSRMPAPVILVYCMLALAFLGAGIWLTQDLVASRTSIIEERSALALQTSKFMSQWFGTTITSTDYVLRDVTTKVNGTELELARSDRDAKERLTALSREKLATLPGVQGLGFIDKQYVFVAAGEERVVGFRSNSRLHA